VLPACLCLWCVALQGQNDFCRCAWGGGGQGDPTCYMICELDVPYGLQWRPTNGMAHTVALQRGKCCIEFWQQQKETHSSHVSVRTVFTGTCDVLVSFCCCQNVAMLQRPLWPSAER